MILHEETYELTCDYPDCSSDKSSIEFFEIFFALSKIRKCYPEEGDKNFELRKEFYDFGRQLAWDGKIPQLLAFKNWKKLITENPSLKEIEKLEKEIQDWNPEIYKKVGFFLYGLQGNLFPRKRITKLELLLNLAGYDIYLEAKNE